ncbi:hypothetical protein H5410_016743 [Solanum commersonii]|uniref:Uncharacterized protein n=1 Tax=Solanum commersonii TaxID=4109 RepID=A0A9J5ZYK0_SOLCO|nr:hypothetical protein H5410_016743 [Solanum commersonii]
MKFITSATDEIKTKLIAILTGDGSSSITKARKGSYIEEGKIIPKFIKIIITDLVSSGWVILASIAKEVDDIKTYEKVERNDISKTLDITEKRRTLEDIPEVFGLMGFISNSGYFLNDLKQFNKRQIVSFTYWDYIQHLIKFSRYNNERHKHTWFIKVTAKIFRNPIPNWFLNRWSYHANNKNIAQPFHKLYKEWVKVSPASQQIISSRTYLILSLHGFINGFLSRFYRGTNPCLYVTYYNNFGTRIMIDDSTSRKHMARKISNHDEGEQNEMITISRSRQERFF